ncbi:MAG: ABC transporter permease subunit [Phycisphaeraceae bacterium]
MSKRPFQWLLVLIGIVVISAGLGALLMLQDFRAAGRAVITVGQLLADAWIVYGIWAWRQRQWVRFAAILLVFSHLCSALTWQYWSAGQNAWAITVAGCWAMIIAFVLGISLIRLALSPGHPVLGVARTLVDEAIRMKVALVFIILLALILPLLPDLQSRELLNYRIKTFLSWGIGATSLLLSLMTVFLACATISGEIANKQIYLSMSKPVGRLQYLLGKWLGIVLLNLVLLAVAGAGIYTFARILQQQPAQDEFDRLAVDEQVLMARRVSVPVQDESLRAMLDEYVASLRQSDPERYGKPESPRPLTAAEMSTIQKQMLAKWYTIPPRERRTYTFADLDDAPQYGVSVQFRFKPKASQSPPDGFDEFVIYLNDRPYAPVRVADDTFHVRPLPANQVRPDGTMAVGIENANPINRNATFPANLTFPPGDGLQVLYIVAGFETNLLRGLILIWLQLAFLAALGLLAGTFLGFAIACLFSLLVYIVGGASAFLSEALRFYAANPPADASTWDQILWWPSTIISHVGQGQIWEAIKIVIKLAGNIIVTVNPSIGDFSPVEKLSDGQHIPNNMLFDAAWQMGLVWTGLALLLGWLIFRRRELASATT